MPIVFVVAQGAVAVLLMLATGGKTVRLVHSLGNVEALTNVILWCLSALPSYCSGL